MRFLRSILAHPDISGFSVFQRIVVYVLAFLAFMLLPVYFKEHYCPVKVDK